MATKLPTRQLGKDGPHVTALGFGAMGLSAFYGKTESDEERFEVLDRVYELGETNWDSADIYGDNEELIGKWFRRTGKRNDIFLASKFGNHVKPDGTRDVKSDPEYVKEACDLSLKRLGIDCIDLYYCHRVDGKTPIEKTVEAMVELKKYDTHMSEPSKLLRYTHTHYKRTGPVKSNILASPKFPPIPSAVPAKSITSPPSRSNTLLSPLTLRNQRLIS